MPITDNVSKDVLEKAFSTPNPTTIAETDVYKPVVTYVDGMVSLAGEKSILHRSNMEINIPGKQVSNILFMTGAGANLKTQLESILADMDGGPWMADGRDDELTIHNRNYNQVPIAQFTYFGGNGELLSFKAKTTRKEKTLDATSQTIIDPDSKTVNTVTTQGTSPQTTTGDDPEANMEERGPISTMVNGKRYFKPIIRHQMTSGTSTEQAELDSMGLSNWYASGKAPGGTNAAIKKKAKIEALSPKGISAYNQFLSKKYAPTQEEINAYVEQCKNEYGKLREGVKTGDAGSFLNFLSVHNLPKFIIKRSDWVAKWVDPTSYYKDVNSERGVSSNVSDDIQGSSNYYNRWQLGKDYLSSKPSIRIIPPTTPDYQGNTSYGPLSYGGKIQIAEYVEREIPVDGQRILSNINPSNFGNLNDITKSIQEEVVGTGRIIGHPEIVSSKILRLLGLSKKYSGDWYIKNIKHSINSGGYFCDFEVIKKGSTIVRTVVSSSVNVKKIYADVLKAAKARVSRDDIGIDAEEVVMAAITKRKTELIDKGLATEETSFKAVVPESYTYDPGSTGKHTKTIIVVPGSNDAVNIPSERAKQKKQVVNLKKDKK